MIDPEQKLGMEGHVKAEQEEYLKFNTTYYI